MLLTRYMLLLVALQDHPTTGKIFRVWNMVDDISNMVGDVLNPVDDI
jgi:hypothetical protein